MKQDCQASLDKHRNALKKIIQALTNRNTNIYNLNIQTLIKT